MKWTNDLNGKCQRKDFPKYRPIKFIRAESFFFSYSNNPTIFLKLVCEFSIDTWLIDTNYKNSLIIS